MYEGELSLIVLTGFASIGLFNFIEHAYILSWNFTYFTRGVLTYQEKFFLGRQIDILSAIYHAQMAITPNLLHGSIEFNEIKPNVFLLRRKQGEVRFYGLGRYDSTRRVLYYDPITGIVEIKGFLLWSYLPAWVFFLGMLFLFLLENFSFLSLLIIIVIALVAILFSLYPVALDSKVNDEVIYHLRTVNRKQLTSRR
jgi:hypothetical protein